MLLVFVCGFAPSQLFDSIEAIGHQFVFCEFSRNLHRERADGSFGVSRGGLTNELLRKSHCLKWRFCSRSSIAGVCFAVEAWNVTNDCDDCWAASAVPTFHRLQCFRHTPVPCVSPRVCDGSASDIGQSDSPHSSLVTIKIIARFISELRTSNSKRFFFCSGRPKRVFPPRYDNIKETLWRFFSCWLIKHWFCSARKNN